MMTPMGPVYLSRHCIYNMRHGNIKDRNTAKYSQYLSSQKRYTTLLLEEKLTILLHSSPLASASHDNAATATFPSSFTLSLADKQKKKSIQMAEGDRTKVERAGSC